MQASAYSRAAAASPSEIVEHLRRPEAYPDRPARIDVVETHFAWVFLGERFAYKMKKRIEFHRVDFTTLEKRRAACEIEVVLNRRLAEAVYLGTVPLCATDRGLELEGAGEVVDWLVKMHRLASESTLEAAAVARSERTEDLQALIDKLARFYATTERAPWDAEDYREHLRNQNREWAEQVVAASGGSAPAALERLAEAQARFLDRRAALLAPRIESGRVVDAHGDLRPEHVFLAADPEIIDCLEFSSDLRLLDTAEELGFLDLECERLGRADLGSRLFETYKARCADPIRADLYGFYRSRRGLARALVSAWHLEDDMPGDARDHWLATRDWYLAAALDSLRPTSPRKD